MCAFSKWKAFKLATLSGLAEPLGVIIVGLTLYIKSFLYMNYYGLLCFSVFLGKEFQERSHV